MAFQCLVIIEVDAKRGAIHTASRRNAMRSSIRHLLEGESGAHSIHTLERIMADKLLLLLNGDILSLAIATNALRAMRNEEFRGLP